MFNLSDLQCPIIFLLAKVSLLVGNRTDLAFKTAIAKINLITIATFFDEMYKIIFNHLFTTKSSQNGLLGLCQYILELQKLIVKAYSIFITWFNLKA